MFASVDSLDSLVGAVTVWSGSLDTRERIRVGQRLASLGEAIQTSAAAELVGSDGDTKAAQRALGGRKTSKRAARRSAKRAAAAAKNPTIGAKMAANTLSGEQVDALVDADKKTDGTALADDALVDQVAARRRMRPPKSSMTM